MICLEYPLPEDLKAAEKKEYVSDAAVEAVIADLKVTREKRRAIQSMNRDELQRYLVHLYRAGFEAGADAIQKHLAALSHADDEGVEEVTVCWEDVLNVIADVKGIGPKLLGEIDKKLREEY